MKLCNIIAGWTQYNNPFLQINQKTSLLKTCCQLVSSKPTTSYCSPGSKHISSPFHTQLLWLDIQWQFQPLPNTDILDFKIYFLGICAIYRNNHYPLGNNGSFTENEFNKGIIWYWKIQSSELGDTNTASSAHVTVLE